MNILTLFIIVFLYLDFSVAASPIFEDFNLKSFVLAENPTPSLRLGHNIGVANGEISEVYEILTMKGIFKVYRKEKGKIFEHEYLIGERVASQLISQVLTNFPSSPMTTDEAIINEQYRSGRFVSFEYVDPIGNITQMSFIEVKKVESEEKAIGARVREIEKSLKTLQDFEKKCREEKLLK